MDIAVEVCKVELAELYAPFEVELAKEVGRLQRILVESAGELVGRLKFAVAAEVGRLQRILVESTGAVLAQEDWLVVFHSFSNIGWRSGSTSELDAVDLLIKCSI